MGRTTRRERLKSALYLRAKFLKYAQDVFKKSSENSFETPKGCLSCSIRLENHFFPNWKQKTFFLKKKSDLFLPENVTQCQKRGPFGIFLNILSVASGNKTFVKSHSAGKNRKGIFALSLHWPDLA